MKNRRRYGFLFPAEWYGSPDLLTYWLFGRAKGTFVEVIVNGEMRRFPDGMTVAQLLKDMVLTDKRLAIEVNREIVPRSTHGDYRLQAGDRVEIVHAIGGG